jgi:hypothetical protein
LGKSARRLSPPPGIRTRRQRPVSRSTRKCLVRTELDRLTTVTLLPRPLSRPPLSLKSRSSRSGSPLGESIPSEEGTCGSVSCLGDLSSSQRSRPCSWSAPTQDPKVMTRGWPLAGPAVSRVRSLHIEGSRPAPHQEGWALEALKYAGSYVPPTSLALSPSTTANCGFKRRPQMTLSAKPFREEESPPCDRRPLANKGGVQAKRALSGAIRLPARLTRSPLCPEGRSCDRASPARRTAPRGRTRASLTDIVRRRLVYETGDEPHHKSPPEDRGLPSSRRSGPRDADALTGRGKSAVTETSVRDARTA